MSKDLTFAGVNLRTTYGLVISGSGTYDSPVRTYEKVSVPGRDGDVILPEKRLENVTIKYPAFIPATNFETNYAGLRAFLLSKVGYQRLTDGYHSGEYRMAYFPGALLPEMERNLKLGRFDLEFVCKPQRFLTAGESATTLTASGTFNNTTLYDSLPLVKVYKATSATSGSVTINSVTATINWSGVSSPIYIDCDMMDCYYMSGSAKVAANDKVSFNSLYFPTFKPGSNGITLGSGVSKVEYTPHTFTV